MSTDDASPSPLLVERRGAVSILTLNRPQQRNALDAPTIGALGRALREAESDPGVAVVVLTGAGDRAFCAGIDLKAFAAAGGPPLPSDGPGLEVLLREAYPKPVVAAVNGSAFAAGFELLLACDLIVAATHAKLGLPEVKWGLAAGRGLELLPRRVPLAIALELALTGEPVDADRAAALGLVNRVVPGERVLTEAVMLAEKIAANGPLAVRFTKAQLRRVGDGAHDQAAHAAYVEALSAILASEDAREGALAFAQHRPPKWRGR